MRLETDAAQGTLTLASEHPTLLHPNHSRVLRHLRSWPGSCDWSKASGWQRVCKQTLIYNMI